MAGLVIRLAEGAVVGALLALLIAMPFVILDGAGSGTGYEDEGSTLGDTQLTPEPLDDLALEPAGAGASTQSQQVEESSEVDIHSEVLDAVTETWPSDSERAKKIALCESGAGLHPDAWDLHHPDGGPMQINKFSWADHFYEKYGWTWDQIVLDLDIHLAAAREIYDITGGWEHWSCADAVLTSQG